MESFINENMALINGLNRRFICSSLGVYLIGKKQVWTESAELFSVSNISVKTEPYLSPHLFRILNILFRDFDTLPSTNFKRKQNIIYL
ncbi:hypothetical protein SDC9_129903 [bioreactor metagenome]|uniref:Uncharacterized protein n=1 Tax=bioreactor metagenome TaxID=1076179 RepID=A0A645D159_9ZZZZ